MSELEELKSQFKVLMGAAHQLKHELLHDKKDTPRAFDKFRKVLFDVTLWAYREHKLLPTGDDSKGTEMERFLVVIKLMEDDIMNKWLKSVQD